MKNGALAVPAAPPMSAADAVMAVAVAAAVSDGRLRPLELEGLRRMAHVSPLFSGVENVDSYLDALAREMRRLGPAAFLERAAASMDARLAETAYAWAVELVQADDTVYEAEHRFLENVRRLLGIHPALASKMRTVAAIRRRG